MRVIYNKYIRKAYKNTQSYDMIVGYVPVEKKASEEIVKAVEKPVVKVMRSLRYI